MTSHLPVATALVALAGLTGCYVDSDCTPTRTAARAATKVNVGAAARSAVVDATLTTRGGEPLPGMTLTFDLLDDDASVYTDDASTGSGDRASVDLKRADADALLGIVRADSFRASFSGDGEYCASSDTAAFRAVRT
jgi:hypothetical protein